MAAAANTSVNGDNNESNYNKNDFNNVHNGDDNDNYYHHCH